MTNPNALLHRRDVVNELVRDRRDLLVIAAGAMKQRSNDTFYQYRAHSAFSHLTGWGSDSEPGAVLVMDPIAADEGRGSAETHEATLYFRERAGRDSFAFLRHRAQRNGGG